MAKAVSPRGLLASALFQCRGFTLLELIVVVFLMGIMLGFSVPAFRGAVLTDDEETVVRKIILATRHLRDKSITTGRPYALVLDLDTGKAWLSPGQMRPNQMEANPESESLIDIDRTITAVTYFPEQLKVTSGKALIRFYPEGYSDWAMLECRQDGGSPNILVSIEPFISQARLIDL